MLVTTINNAYQLERLFREYGRENHFSYGGFDALYNHLDEFSNEIGEPFEVDVIGLCCDFTEYSGWEELYNNYSYSYNNKKEGWEDTDRESFMEWVNERTTVIEVTNYKNDIVGVIIQNFNK